MERSQQGQEVAITFKEEASQAKETEMTMPENQRRRYNDDNAMPPSCLACQESWMKYQGVVMETLARVEKMADENQKILAQVPILTTRQENGLNRVGMLEDKHEEFTKSLTSIKIDQARQRGVMTVIGTGAGLLAGGVIDFFFGKMYGRH